MTLPMGLTADGLQIPTQQDIFDDIAGDVTARFGSTLDTGPTQPLGEFIDIFAERYALLCELVEAVYGSQDPDSAGGAAQDQICALTGTIREEATPSLVTLTLTGTPTTSVTSGSRAGAATGVQFATISNATIGSLLSWAGATPYIVGDRRTNSGRVYIVRTAGTSAGSGGPTTTDADIPDGTVHWRYLGDGTGAIDAPSAATETGPQDAPAFSVVEIITPVGGWSGVTNLLDADPGTNIESDQDLRVRRETDLANAGTSPVDAIRADLERVEGVTSVTVFQNETDSFLGTMTPHSVEALVQGGDDQDIFDQLLRSVAGGIITNGSTVGTATDASGNVYTMSFTRPTLVPIYIDVFVTKDATLYPVDGDAQVKQAIVDYGDTLPVGRNAVASALGSRAFNVPGVLDVTLVELGTAPSPSSSATVVIASRELATYDTGRITVTSISGTP